MKKLILALLLPLTFCAAAHSQSKDDQMGVLQDFFVGTWKVEGKESYERWSVLSDGSLVGRGYKVKAGSEKTTENVEIRRIEGKIYYLATVPDQNDGKTVRFVLTRSVESEYVFENPDHDFPKKLVFKKESSSEMRVRVLGAEDKGFSFKMKKSARGNR